MRITSTPFLLDVGVTPANQRLYNDGPNTVYYKSTSTVSSTSNDGSVASGASLDLTASQWIVAGSGLSSNVRLLDLAATGSGGGGSGAALGYSSGPGWDARPSTGGPYVWITDDLSPSPVVPADMQAGDAVIKP